jgi:hypothetical protein
MEAAGFENKEKREMKEASVVDNLTREEKNSAKILIKNFTIDFDSRNYQNPTLQKFYSGLQSLALEENEPELVEDYLEPDYEFMKRYQPAIDKFKNTFFDGMDSEQEASVNSSNKARIQDRKTASN